MKVRALQYKKNWNVDDFIGKNHLARIDKEQATPIPGTQIRKEQDYKINKEKDRKLFEESLEASEKEWKAKTKIKCQLAEIRARVYVEAVIGVPLGLVEEVIRNKVIHNVPDVKVVAQDSPEAIAKFLKNVELGRHLYVGFAVVQGFRSINHQDPHTGNTALHVAVRLGLVEVVKELLEFKINPDTRNRLGNTAVHDAWLFWRNPSGFQGKHRTRDERIEQEKKTCAILSHILSFGGFVDMQDSNGQTILHIACRLGPIRAVIKILEFKGNHTITDFNGQSILDIAEKNKNKEIKKILLSWDMIKNEMRKSDFKLLWGVFMKNYEAEISSEKSAEFILSDFSMNLRIKLLNRGNLDYIPVDDDLLRYHDDENKKNRDNNIGPYEVLGTVGQIPKPWDKGWNDFAKKIEIEKKEKIKAERRRQRMMDMEDSGGENSNDENNDTINNSSVLSSIILNENDPLNDTLNNQNPNFNRSVITNSVNSFQSSNTPESHLSYTDKMQPLPRPPLLLNNEMIQRRRILKKLYKHQEDHQFTENLTMKKLISNRRKQAALMIASDANYIDCTVQSALSSVLLNPKRIQDITFEQKQEAIRMKENIYNHIVLNTKENSIVEKATSSMRQDAFQRERIPLIRSRAQFIESVLLPPVSVTSVTDKIAAERRQYENNQSQLIQKDSTAQLDLSIDSVDSLDSADNNGNNENNGNTFPEKNAMSISRSEARTRRTAHRKLVLKKTTVEYGKGRLTSTFNCTVPLEDPW